MKYFATLLLSVVSLIGYSTDLNNQDFTTAISCVTANMDPVILHNADVGVFPGEAHTNK